MCRVSCFFGTKVEDSSISNGGERGLGSNGQQTLIVYICLGYKLTINLYKYCKQHSLV